MMISEARAGGGPRNLLIARLLVSTTLAFPSLAGVTFFLHLMLTAGFEPFRIGCLRNYK
jgi:hypothetical protein